MAASVAGPVIRRRMARESNDYRRQLEEAFTGEGDEEWKRAEKRRLYRELRQGYEQLKGEWDGDDRYDAWFAEGLNNARLAGVGAYRELLPAFEALLDQHDRDLESFYEAVEALATLDPEIRRRRLVGSGP